MLNCGAAARVVTPPLGLNIPQCMQFNPSTGIKDDLYTHALAVEHNGVAAILISIDTSGLGTDFAERVRAAIFREIGVPAEAVMVSAIHIHTGGPQLMDVFWGQGEDESVNELFLRETVAAAVEAYRNRVPAVARFAEGKETRISFCRNYHMADGSIKTNPGRRRAAEIVAPTTPIDPTLSVLQFESKDGRPIAEIVNFACHPDVTSGHEYSADYPGEMRRNLKTVYGNDYTVLFFNGCSGNINHIDAQRYIDPEFRYAKDHYKTMGGILAEDVLALHKDMKRMESDTVAFLRRYDDEPRRQPTAENLQWAKECIADADGSKVDKRLAEELFRLQREPRPTERVELQVIRIGDVFLAGFPGEPFSDMGLRLRELTAPQRLMISELANNELGYFATEPAYSGNVYEGMLPSAPFTPDVLDRMVERLADMINRL